MLRRLRCVVLGLLLAGAARAQDPPPATAPAINTFAQITPEIAAQKTRPDGDNSTEPERIARLERSVKGDEQRLADLKRSLDDPQGDYARAEAAFKELDERLNAERKALQEAAAAKDNLSTEILKAEIAEIEKKWAVAKKAFQLAIDERKAIQGGVATLATKIGKDQEALERLRGNTPVVPPAPPPQTTPPAPGPTAPAPAKPLEIPAVVPPNGLPNGLPNTVPWPNNAAPDPKKALEGAVTPAPSAAAPPKPKPDERLQKAEKAAAKTEAAAQQAEQIAATTTERLENLRQDIALQRELRKVAENKIDVARDELHQLNTELERFDAAATRRAVRETEERLISAQAEWRRISEHVDDLRNELDTLQREQVAAMQEAENKRQQADAAQQTVKSLNNPFSLRNIVGWLTAHGLFVFTVVSVVFLLLRSGKLLEGRMTALVTRHGVRGSQQERHNQAQTLVSVLHNTLRTVAVAGAVVLVLDEVGVPVGPILGGAAVIGLAVAFGAQSLIKDCFTGFMILIEQQYMINDVIRIGDTAGQVERITLRMTALRDEEGNVHFVPHGQIATVTNLTHGWSRAVFEIRTGYHEDCDRVMNEILRVAAELRKDAKFGPMIIDDAEMLGVTALGEYAVVLKFYIRTKPLQQWAVKRETLRRIKRRFDEAGISFPYPHHTVMLPENSLKFVEGARRAA